jgi:hypothetical protein
VVEGALLEAQGGLGLLDLRGEPGRVLRVVRGVGLELVGDEHGQPLPLLDGIPLVHGELADLAGDLRAHEHVVRGHDPGEGDRLGAEARPGEGGSPDHGDEEEYEGGPAFHGILSNICIKHLF